MTLSNAGSYFAASVSRKAPHFYFALIEYLDYRCSGFLEWCSCGRRSAAISLALSSCLGRMLYLREFGFSWKRKPVDC